ncbi:VacJ family lipoprotein [Pseudomonas syringae pv. actinidiae]|nr:VacJ family lipoprotein [Pseudomonas syringae pv. actinidiae]
MAKRLLLLAALLCAGTVQAADADTGNKAQHPATVARQTDADGFTQPLKSLQFNPGLDQREFERASINALEVYDPLESWNRRVYHFNYRFDEWVFLPVVDGYRYVTPGFVRSGVSNFFSNLATSPTW